jgi:hypothetical protein
MTIRPVCRRYDIRRQQLNSVLSKQIDEGISTFPLVLKETRHAFREVSDKSIVILGWNIGIALVDKSAEYGMHKGDGCR